MQKVKIFFYHGLVAAILCATAAEAQVSNVASQENPKCHLSATLEGQTVQFWETGQDSWAGAGQIVCSRNILRVWVWYKSWVSGVGVFKNKPIEISIKDVPPSRVLSLLAIHRTVIDNTASGPELVAIKATAYDKTWMVEIRSKVGSINENKISFDSGRLAIQPLQVSK